MSVLSSSENRIAQAAEQLRSELGATCQATLVIAITPAGTSTSISVADNTSLDGLIACVVQSLGDLRQAAAKRAGADAKDSHGPSPMGN